MKKNIIRLLFLVLVIFVNINLVPLVWTTNMPTYLANDNIIALVDTDEEKPVEVNHLVKDLQEEYNNTDIKAVLTIDNTDYSTPVMQTKDNKFYLFRNLYKKKDEFGTPFVDYRVDLNNAKKTLIFGHNSIYRHMAFEILNNYYEESYYKDHQYITLYLENDIKKYQIFSVYVETKDFDYYDMKYTEEEWNKHINKLKNKSFYETNVDVESEDNILILQTCSTSKKFKTDKYKFIIVVAKEV